jgi:ubiquinone/menaquinone biosynthesis C-methylase UbiE
MSDAAAPTPQQQVAAVFDRVADGYDREALRFFPFVADRLIARLRPAPGDKLLDVATGTGAVALAAAQAVGAAGRVTAIDLSEGMLARLEAKLAKFGISNVDLHVMDAGALEFRRDYFHHVVCSFGLFFLPDMPAAVRQWVRVARPGGAVMFTTFGPRAFSPMMALLRAGLAGAGVELPAQRLAEADECRALLRDAGLVDVEIFTEQHGYHLGSELDWWEVVWNSACRGVCERLSPAALEALRSAHLAEVAALKTPSGVWLDVETHFVIGRKSA